MTAPASYWPGALRAALVEQLLGPPRRWRWLRILFWLAFTIAFALAIPRLDRWPAGSLLPVFLIGIPFSGVVPMYRERLLRRSKSRQIAVFLAAVIAQAAAFIGFVVVSVRFGPEPGQSPIEHLAARLAAVDIPLWLVVSLLVFLAFWSYRSNKREEAALRARGDAEQSGLSAPPN